MGKKKEKQKQNGNLGDESNPENELKTLVHEHSLFFDKLVDLIPAKFYLPTDDNEKVWFSGLSKAKKASAKKQSRENIKKARRDRLDPKKSSATTLDLLMQNLEKEESKDEGDDEHEEDDRAVTYEELRQRLRDRIAQLRSGRNSNGSDNHVKRNAENRRKAVDLRKRKRENDNNDATKTTQAAPSERLEKDVEEAAKALTFGHVKIGDEEQRAKKRKKLSKLEQLERAKELAEAKKDPEKGAKHSWRAATDRAAGVKVHDDPKRMKQSIQKEKKQRQKNAEKWKERNEGQQQTKAEKQQKRSKNIADRAQQKKQRKIDKREKKLMRAGFEGRKEGYLNDTSS